MSEGISIRKCRLDECDIILRMWKASGALSSATDNIEVLQNLIENPNSTLLVAEYRGNLAGTVIAGWDGWRGNIYRLTVLPEYRRRGIGKQLLKAAEDFLASKGARRVSGLAAPGTPLAIPFWDSTVVSGYTKDSSFIRYTKNL